MAAALTDAQLEAVLGHCGGIRGATLEEGALMLADFLEYRGERLARRRQVSERTLSHAILLTRTARVLRTLIALSREGDGA